eukprot:3842411-Rhodomonas_salina.1
MLALPFARNTTNMASHSAYPGQNGYSAAGGDSARTFEQQPTAQAPPHMNNGPVPHEHDQDSGNFLNGFSLPFMPSVFGSRMPLVGFSSEMLGVTLSASDRVCVEQP